VRPGAKVEVVSSGNEENEYLIGIWKFKELITTYLEPSCSKLTIADVP